MAQTPDETPRPSQAEGEPTPGSTSSPAGDKGKAPRPSQAEGEAGQAETADIQDDPTLRDGPTSADVGGRSRVQHGDQFRAGQTEPASGSEGSQPTSPRPSQAEGELDPGSTSSSAGKDKAPRPSQAEGEDDASS